MSEYLENLIPSLDVIQAEQSVLGGLLIEPENLKILYLVPEDFYKKIHQNIYTAMLELSKKQIPIDLTTVISEMKEEKTLMTGDVAYLAQLAMIVPNAVNIAYYARIVKRDSIRRQIILRGVKLAEGLALEDARQIAGEILNLNESIDDRPFSEVFNEDDFERLSKSKRFYSDNLHLLTHYLPFVRGENIYIAGKTSTGKTQLALNLAISFLKQGASVGYVSMEIGREQLLIRLLNWEVGGQVKLSDIDIRDRQWWDAGMALIKEGRFKQFYFTEEYNKLEDIVSWIEAHNFDIVFIDYIQLIRYEGRNRVEELGEIAKEFRRLSKKRCMVILSQFNRQRDEDEEEIDLSRIRDSGEIEQTATGVILIRRDKKDMNQFYYAIAKNQTVGTLTLWKSMTLQPNGEFKEDF